MGFDTIEINVILDVVPDDPVVLYTQYFFIRIDIFQPSLKPILNFWRFQPQNILKLFLKF